jgi:hypothetical protein
MAIRWLTVFLDFPADSFQAGVAFWQAATGYGLSASRGAAGEFATLLPPSGDAYLRVQRVADGAGGCHLDLHVDTETESLAAAADRARALGAEITLFEPGLVVTRSPSGFPFCLVDWEGEAEVPAPLAGENGSWTRLDTLCIDVPPWGFEAECAFWATLTGWEAYPAPLPGYAFLRSPTGLPVRIILQRQASAAPGQLAAGHTDFGVTDHGAVGRHVALGARVTAPLDYWTVLTDPADRPYCLVNRPPMG